MARIGVEEVGVEVGVGLFWGEVEIHNGSAENANNIITRDNRNNSQTQHQGLRGLHDSNGLERVGNRSHDISDRVLALLRKADALIHLGRVQESVNLCLSAVNATRSTKTVVSTFRALLYLESMSEESVVHFLSRLLLPYKNSFQSQFTLSAVEPAIPTDKRKMKELSVEFQLATLDRIEICRTILYDEKAVQIDPQRLFRVHMLLMDQWLSTYSAWCMWRCSSVLPDDEVAVDLHEPTSTEMFSNSAKGNTYFGMLNQYFQYYFEAFLKIEAKPVFTDVNKSILPKVKSGAEALNPNTADQLRDAKGG